MSLLSRLYDFVAGTKIKSSEVDAEFNQLVAGHNDHDGKINTHTTQISTITTNTSNANTKADNAVTTANAANTKADNAVTTANGAVTTANAAYLRSGEAITSAGNANTTATTAKTTAETVKTDYDIIKPQMIAAMESVANKVDKEYVDQVAADYQMGIILYDMEDGATSWEAFQNHQKDFIRQPGYGVTAGSANTYTLTLSPVPGSYAEGMAIALKIHAANTGASTVNVNSLGAIPLKKAGGLDLAGGSLKLGSIYTFRYTSGNFILQGEGGEIPKLPNILKNGSFENGLNCWDWSLISSSTGRIYHGTRSLIFSNNGSQTCYIRQDIIVPGGHKVYITCMANLISCAGVNGLYLTPSDTANTTSYGAVHVNPALLNQWQRLSTIAALPPGSPNVKFRLYSYNTAANGYVDAAMVIDLTELFGEGNEPTKDEMDSIVAKYSQWWDSDLTALTSDANATDSYIVQGYSAYVNGQKLSGILPNKTNSGLTINPSTSAQAIPQGAYFGALVDGKVAAVTGTATSADVLAGKTFSSANGINLTGAFNGKRFATGNVTVSGTILNFLDAYGGGNSNMYVATVTGLTFLPSIILLKAVFGGTQNSFILYSESYFGKTAKIFHTTGNLYSTVTYEFKTEGNAYVNASGFRLPVNNTSGSSVYDWIAIE